jgi:integrase
MSDDEKPRSDFLYPKVAKGRPNLYFRFPRRFGVMPVSLPVDQTSKDFQRQYDACLVKLGRMEADERPEPPRTARPKSSLSGSIAKAIEIYRASKRFTKLKPESQRVYKIVLERMKVEIGNEALREMDRDAAERHAARIYREDGSAQMSDLHLTLINNIWKEVRTDEQFGIKKLPNPALEIERKYKRSDSQPHLRWDEDEQDSFDERAPANLLLARHVLHFSTQRGCDAIRMKWAHYDGKGIKVWPQKTTKKDHLVDPNYHLLPNQLIRALDVARQSATSEYILVNQFGRRWASRRSLSCAINRHLVKVGLRKPKQKRGLTMHGLRHTGASDISLLPGVGVKGIMSQTGQSSTRMALHYSEQAEKARANAAMIAAWNAELERKEAERLEKRRGKRTASLRVVK